MRQLRQSDPRKLAQRYKVTMDSLAPGLGEAGIQQVHAQKPNDSSYYRAGPECQWACRFWRSTFGHLS